MIFISICQSIHLSFHLTRFCGVTLTNIMRDIDNMRRGNSLATLYHTQLGLPTKALQSEGWLSENSLDLKPAYDLA